MQVIVNTIKTKTYLKHTNMLKHLEWIVHTCTHWVFKYLNALIKASMSSDSAFFYVFCDTVESGFIALYSTPTWFADTKKENTTI